MNQGELFDGDGDGGKPPRDPNPNPLVLAYGLDPLGRGCSSCAHLTFRDRNARYYKCRLRLIMSSARTDHRLGWDACAQFTERRIPIPPRELENIGPAGAHHEHGGGSRDAADKIERHGAKAQRRHALALVRGSPGATTNELSEGNHAGNELALRVLLQRRLPELRDCSEPLIYSIPRKGVRGQGLFRWYPAHEGSA